MSLKNTILVVSLVALFTVSINAAEQQQIQISPELANAILNLDEELQKLRKEEKALSEALAAVAEGQKIPLALRIQKIDLARRFMALKEKALKEKANLSNN